MKNSRYISILHIFYFESYIHLEYIKTNDSFHGEKIRRFRIRENMWWICYRFTMELIWAMGNTHWWKSLEKSLQKGNAIQKCDVRSVILLFFVSTKFHLMYNVRIQYLKISTKVVYWNKSQVTMKYPAIFSDQLTFTFCSRSWYSPCSQ